MNDTPKMNKLIWMVLALLLSSCIIVQVSFPALVNEPADPTPTQEVYVPPTPTPAPTPLPTVCNQADWGVYVRESANIRARILTAVRPGDCVQVIASEGEWLHVRTNTGITGYTASRFWGMP